MTRSTCLNEPVVLQRLAMESSPRDLSVLVYELLEERGQIDKDEIDTLFSPTSAEYLNLKRTLLERLRVALGPKRVGGFVLNKLRRAQPEDDGITGPVMLTEWERQAVERLGALLTYDDLEELLGHRLVWTLRVLRKQMSGEDRRSRKEELAAALVVKHGTELFQDTLVRERVHKRLNAERSRAGLGQVECPLRWHPGKNAAVSFVTAGSFPKELVGVPSDDRPPDFEFLEGRVALGPLEPFQTEVLVKSLGVVNTPAARAIVTLPTGAGKTRTAVEVLQQWLTTRHQSRRDHPRQVILWLAHTEELCEQAYACFRQVWESAPDVCPLYLFRFWGDYTKDLINHRDTLRQALASPSAFISTPQRIANLIAEHTTEGEHAMASLRNAAGAVVVDEAHRAAAPTYSTILKLFHLSDGPAVLGLTATPFRMEYIDDGAAGTRKLLRLFDNTVVEPLETLGDAPREKLQQMGILAKPIMESLQTSIRLSLPPGTDSIEPDEAAVERIDHKLKLDADRAQRRILVLKRMLDICRQDAANSVLYFGPTVADAEQMAFLLRQHGVSSAVVSASTRDATRRQIVSEFKNGEIRVLCNCEVLTTGFDAPRVTHIVVARPTVSQVLYEQMVGRGLRGPKFGGTEHCVIVNCEDDYRDQRPQLGYVGWRNVWKPQQQAVP
jgi:superfamily II DNA or RNA helicase